MSDLSLEQEQYFQSILDAARSQGNDRMNDWERSFFSDQAARFEEYGQGTRFSSKQWAIIMKIGDLFDIERVEY